jgi:hypothetical protein
VTREQQLEWEARWSRPVAAASIAAGLMLLVSAMIFFPKDREGIERAPDLLLSIDQQSGAYLASAILTALSALLLLGVFLYLFRAIDARGGGVPRWFVYLVIGAPIVYAVSAMVYAVQAVDVADEFASGRPIRGEAGDDRAQDISDISGALIALQTAGTVGVAFLFVMLPLRARRVGLLTPFMGILGAIAGALVVFQLAGISAVVQAFWLAALGALFLGRWPGGRGPAWETGEADRWPTAAERRAELTGEGPAEEPAPALDPGEPPPEPEPMPERPASRKRRRKKGR